MDLSHCTTLMFMDREHLQILGERRSITKVAFSVQNQR